MNNQRKYVIKFPFRHSWLADFVGQETNEEQVSISHSRGLIYAHRLVKRQSKKGRPQGSPLQKNVRDKP